VTRPQTTAIIYFRALNNKWTRRLTSSPRVLPTSTFVIVYGIRFHLCVLATTHTEVLFAKKGGVVKTSLKEVFLQGISQFAPLEETSGYF
jgi:hypothetical protein